MFREHSVGIAIPCFNEESNLPKVIHGLPAWIDSIVIVNDASNDATAAVASQLMTNDKRISLIDSTENKGVGASIASAMMLLRDNNIDVAVVMAGDNQMDPKYLPALISPIVHGNFDYTKTNRTLHKETVDQIPSIRYFGNSVLSFLTKFASGLWMIGDAQSGYTAASRQVLQSINWCQLYPRYGYPNQLLISLSIKRFRVADLATVPRYGVGERSKLKISIVLFTIPAILLKGFFRRLWQKHFVSDQHPLVIFYFTATGLLALTIQLVAKVISHLVRYGFFPPVASISLVVTSTTFVLVAGLAMWMDIDANREYSARINNGRLIDLEKISDE